MDRRGAAQEHLHAQQLERHAHKYIYVGGYAPYHHGRSGDTRAYDEGHGSPSRGRSRQHG